MNSTANTPASQLYMRAAIVLAVIVSLGFTWLVIVAGALQPNIINMLVQALVVAVIASMLWVVVRRFRRTRQELQLARDTAESEAVLLRKRSAFIYGASSKLSAKLATFEEAIAGLDPNDKNVIPLKRKTAELHELLKRLDTISKLEANMALTSSTVINASQLLDEAASAYQEKFMAIGAALQVYGPKDVMVDGDAQMLREVFISILDNAAKFMPAQGGLMDVAYKVKGHNVTFVFTDNGAGIPADKLPELFQPFSRTDGVMAFNRQGQGLSLYISRLCIEIMGGTIALSSQEGMGTTVSIQLPIVKKHAKKPQ